MSQVNLRSTTGRTLPVPAPVVDARALLLAERVRAPPRAGRFLYSNLKRTLSSSRSHRTKAKRASVP